MAFASACLPLWVCIYSSCTLMSHVSSIFMYTGMCTCIGTFLQHVNIWHLMCPLMLTFLHCVCACIHCPRLAGRLASLKIAFCPSAVKPHSPTVGTDTGKASPLTGITMLQTRRKTPLIFNALLSGLKGTGTWRNCAAKCVFLRKAHCIWLWAERKSEQGCVCVCLCVCVLLADK